MEYYVQSCVVTFFNNHIYGELVGLERRFVIVCVDLSACNFLCITFVIDMHDRCVVQVAEFLRRKSNRNVFLRFDFFPVLIVECDVDSLHDFRVVDQFFDCILNFVCLDRNNFYGCSFRQSTFRCADADLDVAGCFGELHSGICIFFVCIFLICTFLFCIRVSLRILIRVLLGILGLLIIAVLLFVRILLDVILGLLIVCVLLFGVRRFLFLRGLGLLRGRCVIINNLFLDCLV